MKEAFGFNKSERGLPHIVVQSSIFLKEIIICSRKWWYDVGVDSKEFYPVSIEQIKEFLEYGSWFKNVHSG